MCVCVCVRVCARAHVCVRTRQTFSSVRRTKSRTSSSFIPFITTQFTFRGLYPREMASLMDLITLSQPAHRGGNEWWAVGVGGKEDVDVTRGGVLVNVCDSNAHPFPTKDSLCVCMCVRV